MTQDPPRLEPNRTLVFWIGLIGLVVVAVALVARRSRAPEPQQDRVFIVTTTPVLYSLTANVVGSQAEIYNLLPPGSSPHTYALRPADADALSRADALIMNGLGLERFLDQALAHIPSDAQRITASDGIQTLASLPHEDEGGVEEHEGEEPGGPDPHVWLDPQRTVQMVENIARGLATADPPRAATYEENARAYADRLRALNDEFGRALAATARKDFLAFHPAWAYFADRYGVKQVAVIESVPGKEPTARELRELTELVRQTGVRALLVETQFSPRTAEALARDLQLSVQEVNPEGGALSPTGYEDFMRKNVDAFVRALSS